MGGTATFEVANPDCYEVILEDVVFSRNNGSSLAKFSKLNTLKRVQIEKNTIDEQFEAHLLFPSGSESVLNEVRAFKNKGSVLVMTGGMLNISRSSFVKTRSIGKGAIHGTNSVFEIKNSKFKENRSQGKGGAVTLSGESVLKINQSEFSGNAAMYGGAIYSEDGYLFMYKNTFVENEGNIGGAVFGSLRNNKNAIIAESIVKNNSASEKGGGIYMSFYDAGDFLTVIGSQIRNNEAIQGGKNAKKIDF